MTTTSRVGLNSIIAQVKGNLVSEMEGNKVMLNIEQGRYYNFGGIGGEIWDLIESPISIESIIKQLVEIYEVDFETCKMELCHFISQLIINKLAVVTN